VSRKDLNELNFMMGQAAINLALREALLNQDSRAIVIQSYDFSPYIRKRLLKMRSYNALSALASDLYDQYFH
jgi:hypothetical protein